MTPFDPPLLPPKPTLGTILEDLGRSLDIASSKFNTLQDRLNTVLHPSDGEPLGEGCPCPTLSPVPLVAYLQERIERLDALSIRISDTFDRLAL